MIAIPLSVALSPALQQVDWKPPENALVAAPLAFRDEQGVAVRLGPLLRGTPTVLVPVDYDCPNLCGTVLNGLAAALVELPPSLSYRGVVLSIDPHDGPRQAREEKARFLGRLGRSRDWRFLTGSEPAVRALARSIGYRYAYDPATAQYAHPSGFLVLSPQGRIRRPFFGIRFAPAELQAALGGLPGEAKAAPSGFLLRCFHYDPATGRYGPIVQAALQGGALVTLLALVGGIARLARRDRRPPC